MTFREKHPRLVSRFERDIRDVCAIFSIPEDLKKKQLLFSIGIPKLLDINDMYVWLAIRERKEKGEEDATLHEYREELCDALLGIKDLFEEAPGATEEFLTSLQEKCEEFLRGIMKRSTR